MGSVPFQRVIPGYAQLYLDDRLTLDPLTGIVGARLALETIKEITGAGQSMAGSVWLFDGLSGDSRTVRLSADAACPVCSA